MLTLTAGHFHITWVEDFQWGLVIWFEIVLKLARNGLDFLWKFVGNLGNVT